MSAKNNPVIVAGTGDKPSEIEGQVIPGKSLRERWGIPAETKPEKKPDDKPPESEVKPEVKPAPKPRRQPKPVVPPRAATGQFISPKEVAEIANEVVNAGKKKEVEQAKQAAPELTPQQQKKVKVLERMAVLNPANKGLADKYTAETKALAEYQSNWEKDANNKGKKFNLGDAEHETFLADHDVSYDPDEYVEALADLRSEEKTRPFEEKFKTQEQQQQRQQRVNELMPKIVSHQRATGKVFVDQLGEEFKGLLNEGGVIVPEVLTRLQAEGDTHRQVLGMAQQVELMSAELMAIANGLVDFSETNPLHVQMFHFINKQEQDTRKLPPDQQLNGEGKQFATSDEWAKMTAPQREDYWHLTDTDLSALYATEMADAAKKLLDKAESDFNARAERRGLAKKEAAPAAKPAAQPQPRGQEKAERSPVGQIAPRVAPVAEGAKSKTSTLIDRWTK